MTKYLVPIVLFLALGGFLLIGLHKDPSIVPSPLIDRPVPSFSLPRLGEDGVFTDRELLGKVSLLNVWASWCRACLQEHPLLLDLARGDVVPIYGLNYKDTVSEAQHYLANYGDPYSANAFDEAGRVGIEWGVYGVPETFLIDSQGIIRYKHIGPLTREDLEDKMLPAIRRLQNETP